MLCRYIIQGSECLMVYVLISVLYADVGLTYIYVYPNIIYKVEVRLLYNLQSSPFNVTHVCLLWQEIRFLAYENKTYICIVWFKSLKVLRTYVQHRKIVVLLNI